MKKMLLVCLSALLTCGQGCWNYEFNNTDLFPYQLQNETTEQSEEKNQKTQRNQIPAEYVISNFPVIYQMPELPTGCEVTALTMAVNYYGYSADKMEMALKWLPTASSDLYRGSDGRIYGTDPYEYFIGDPSSEEGCVCGPGAIKTAADGYFQAHNIDMYADDITGTDPEELYGMVSQDIPVVVWVTIGMADRQDPVQSWYTEDGRYVDWTNNDHGAVLIGYSSDTVTIADPISGLVEYSREQFENVFESRSCQCIVLREAG